MVDNYIIEPAKVEHFSSTIPRDYDSKILRDFYGNADAVIKPYIDHSYAFTARYKGDIIVIAGLMPIEKGKVEAWMFTSEIFPKHIKYVFKNLKNHINKAEQIFKLRRIQAVVVKDFVPAQRFIERLGFVNETPNGMQNYGPHNETYLMYARTRSWYDVEQGVDAVG
jgi:hypothetical protein